MSVVNLRFLQRGGDHSQKPLFEADPMRYKLFFSFISAEKNRKKFLEGGQRSPCRSPLKSATSASVSSYNKYVLATLEGQISNYSFHQHSHKVDRHLPCWHKYICMIIGSSVTLTYTNRNRKK